MQCPYRFSRPKSPFLLRLRLCLLPPPPNFLLTQTRLQVAFYERLCRCRIGRKKSCRNISILSANRSRISLLLGSSVLGQFGRSKCSLNPLRDDTLESEARLDMHSICPYGNRHSNAPLRRSRPAQTRVRFAPFGPPHVLAPLTARARGASLCP